MNDFSYNNLKNNINYDNSKDESEICVFCHDGSFPGFLCAVAELFNSPDCTNYKVSTLNNSNSLFENHLEVKRDDDRSYSLWKRISNFYDPIYMKNILAAFLSDFPNIDTNIASWMYKTFRTHSLRIGNLGDSDSLAFEKAVLRSNGEAHQLKGLVRFSELQDGSFYSEIEPKNNVLLLLADHFSQRYSSSNFIIHDVSRHSAIIHKAYNENKSNSWTLEENFFTNIENTDDIISDNEKIIRQMWKQYHQSIAIESRINPKLQMSFIPKHYWNHILEMKQLIQ